MGGVFGFGSSFQPGPLPGLPPGLPGGPSVPGIAPGPLPGPGGGFGLFPGQPQTPGGGLPGLLPNLNILPGGGGPRKSAQPQAPGVQAPSAAPVQAQIPGLGNLDFASLEPSQIAEGGSAFAFEDPSTLDPLQGVLEALNIESVPGAQTGVIFRDLISKLEGPISPQELSGVAGLFPELGGLRNPFEESARNVLSALGPGGGPDPGRGQSRAIRLQGAFEDLIKRLNTGIA